jgi:hypothetical protein
MLADAGENTYVSLTNGYTYSFTHAMYTKECFEKDDTGSKHVTFGQLMRFKVPLVQCLYKTMSGVVGYNQWRTANIYG